MDGRDDVDGDGRTGGRFNLASSRSRVPTPPPPSYYARAEKEGGNFEVCDCRRRRLVMNLTSRLEFISVTRRGALALDWGEGGRPHPPPLLLFLPLFPKPVRQFRGCCDLRRRSRVEPARCQIKHMQSRAALSEAWTIAHNATGRTLQSAEY